MNTIGNPVLWCAFSGLVVLVTDLYKVPVAWSLGVVAATIGAVIALSMLRPARPPPE